jgi:hypothetical protein
VQRKAWANWITRGVTTLAGLRNPPRELFLEAQKIAGGMLKSDQIRDVTFKEKADTQKRHAEKEAKAKNLDPQKLEELQKHIDTMAAASGRTSSAELYELSKYTRDGKEVGVYELSALYSEKWLNTLLDKARKKVRELDDMLPGLDPDGEGQ